MTDCEYKGCNEPALENSGKCIFHKPDKNEREAREFFKLIRQEAREPEGELVENREEDVKKWVFEKDLDWSGYRFPGIPTDKNNKGKTFTFNEAEFKQGIDCKGATFQGDPVFRGAEFKSSSNFHNSEFKGNIFFGGAKFEGRASFDNTVFGGVTGFEASFYDVASFGGVQFKDRVWFSDARFNEYAEFGDSEFENKVVFENAKFQGEAWFGGSEFSGITEFSRTKFEGGVGFEKARFEMEVFFNFATFKKPAFFTNAHFEGDAKFKGTEFRDVTSFENTDFNYSCDFGDAVFSKELVLNKTHFVRHPDFVSDLEELSSGVSFETNDIKRSLDFLDDENKLVNKVVIKTGSENEDVALEKKKAIEKLRDLDKQDQENGACTEIETIVQKFTEPQAKIEACREQRLTYEAEGKKEKADQVFIHEMRARRASKVNQFQQLIDWLVADWTCRYGTSWQRVLGISSGFILFFTFMYWGKKISLLISQEGFSFVIVEHTADFFGQALFQSIMIFTTLGFSPRYFEGQTLLQVLAAIESIFGALAVALIVVVFARNWMRG